MSTGQQPNQLTQMAQTLSQYKQNMDFLNSSIIALRQNIERTDISNEEKDALRKQEQDLQSKLGMFQNLITNMSSQLYAQQRVMNQNGNSSAVDNSPLPGSPATYNPQQQPNFNAMQAATLNATQQQQLRNAQQQQQQQQQQHLQNKMTFAAPNTPQQTGASPQTSFASPNQADKSTGVHTFATNDNAGMVNSMDMQPSMLALRPASVPPMNSDGVNRVLTKRKIQELVTQIDPAERLEPEVEDILLEIADEFIESVTAFACKLAKHRKSDVLEVKDVQLHLERNWNIRIPGFAADDIRTVKKPNIPSSHQNKVQAINTVKSQAPSRK